MHPVLVELGPVTIDTFSAIVAIAFFAMTGFIKVEFKRLGFTAHDAQGGTFWAVAGCFIGGRLAYLLVNLDVFLENPGLAFAVWKGGIVSYGGILGMLFAVAIYAMKRNLPFGRSLDFACLSAPLFMGIGRLGCFSAGCDFGKPAPQLPFAVVFDNPYSLIPQELLGTPLHPTQIYMSIANVIVFFVGYTLLKKNLRQGRVFSVVAMLYSVLRFTIEIFRGDIERGFVIEDILSSGQFFCLIWFWIGVWAAFTAGRGIWLLNDEKTKNRFKI